MARSKVKSRSYHDVAHLQPLTNVPTEYVLFTPYGFLRYSLKTLKIKVTTTRRNQGHTMTLPNVSTKYQLPTPYGFRDIC